MPSSLQLRLKLVLGPDTALGPGKADLLEAIGQTGSIAAAGRQLGMSYKRAWMLVETMNGCFKTPLVTSARGGKGGGVGDLLQLALHAGAARIVDGDARRGDKRNGRKAGDNGHVAGAILGETAQGREDRALHSKQFHGPRPFPETESRL